jgi:orotate phosphoribosyltransferase
MTYGLDVFLQTPTCFEMKLEHLTYYGRTSPYIFRTPTPFTAAQLHAIGSRGAGLVYERARTGPVHIIGVASRGVPLATAIAMDLDRFPNMQASLSQIGKSGSDEHLCANCNGYTVVVDNAVVSGRTMELVIRRLQSHGISLDLVIYLFDREEVDYTGLDTATRVAQEFGCQVVPIFSLRDVIDAVDNAADRNVLLDYAARFGTESVRSYVSSRAAEG